VLFRSEKEHLNNILLLKNYAEESFANILDNKIYKVGTAQKLLNLTLKYWWCCDWILIPPHCPIDRIVLNLAGIKTKKWTDIINIEQYQQIISQMKNNLKCDDLAKWELENYTRR
jgi:hypothetical protein